MDPGEQLIRWTIRLSMLCYGLFLSGSLAGLQGRWHAIRRFLWIAAAMLMAAHFYCAFQFHHNWSHASAVRATAIETSELMGFEFGAGIYFNYFVVAIWVVDALWWWFRAEHYSARPRWLSVLVHFYIFFIVFNGTIVFEPGITRYVGIVVCIVLLGLLVKLQLSVNPTAAHRQNT